MLKKVVVIKMDSKDVILIILLILLLICSIATIFTKKLLTSVVIYMSFSLIMSVVWVILQAPDLAITEAAVGAGITSILYFVTLDKIKRIQEALDNHGKI